MPDPWFEDPKSALQETDTLAEAGTADKAAIEGAELVLTNQTVGTTAPSAGAGAALPATPAGYLTVSINGVTRQIAYY